MHLSSSFEPDVVCSVSVITTPTVTDQLFCLHVFRQAGPPPRVDYLALRWEIALIACLHDQSKSGFFGGLAFFQPIRAF